MPSIQVPLERKMNLFLMMLGDENLLRFSGGLCNAFAFMNFRSAAFGLINPIQKRIQMLLGQEEETLQQLAEVFQEYKKERLLLITEEKGEMESLNRQLALYDAELDNLRKQEKKFKDEIESLEEEIRRIRDQREELIKQNLSKKFGSEKWQKLKESQDLYTYIHSLVAAFNPGGDLSFHIGGEYVHQYDYIKILQLFPPDEKEQQISIENVFQVAFNFTKEELITLFSDSTICRDGDLIQLNSTNHAIFLIKNNGRFELYDPNLVELPGDSPLALVSAIQERFFHGRPTDYMPIGINIVARTGMGQGAPARPHRIAVLENLLDKRPILNIDAKAWDGATATWMAARYGHLDTLKLLIRNNANLNISGSEGLTPAHIAAEHGHVDFLRALAEAGVDLNTTDESGQTPVFQVANCGDPNVIKTLAELKADLSKADVKDCTLLWMVAKIGYSEIIKTLVELKADFNQANEDGCTPLWIAAAEGQSEALKLLVEAKANVNTPDLEGATPARMAIKNNHAHVIQTLMNLQSNLDKPDQYGEVPLHFAIKQSRIKIIKMLLDYGINTNRLDRSGHLPIDYATEQVKSFIILQQLKTYIKTHSWEEGMAKMADKQFRFIESLKVEDETDWSAALATIQGMVNDYKPDGNITLFGRSEILSEKQFLDWFSSKETLYENVSKALAKENLVRKSSLSK